MGSNGRFEVAPRCQVEYDNGALIQEMIYFNFLRRPTDSVKPFFFDLFLFNYLVNLLNKMNYEKK